ncbi:MAG: hypothetical protein R3A48_09620 [Polyangiales bacterium]
MRSPTSEGGRPIRSLAACLAVALAARLAVILAWPCEPAWDGHYYARLAARLAAGQGYTDARPWGAEATAFWPPGLPFALAPLLRLGASPRVAAACVNLSAAALACAAVHHAAARRDGPEAGARAAMIYALYPGLVLWSTAAMTETLTGALLAASVWIALPRNGFVSGLGVGLAALARPPSLLLTAAPLVARRGLRATLLCVAGAAAVVAPWTLRNARALDGAALVSTNGGSNLLIGATSAGGGYARLQGRYPACDAAAGEVARDRCWRARALEVARARPLRWLARGGARLARTMLLEVDPAAHLAWSARPPASPARSALAALCTLAWWWLLASFARGASGDGESRVAAYALGATALTHAVFLGADRYHLVLVPLLCPLAARARR